MDVDKKVEDFLDFLKNFDGFGVKCRILDDLLYVSNKKDASNKACVC